jgi:hypothetical protein
LLGRRSYKNVGSTFDYYRSEQAKYIMNCA